MFMHQTDEIPGQLDEEFSRPVESIMRCEDFKSNFARKLSNRYISRSPVTTKRQNSVKLFTPGSETVDNAPERFEQCSQLSKIRIMPQTVEMVKTADNQKNHNIRDTEVSALNMAIETLKWQLTQTEANRQMHIALLKQVVTFLSRVKEHIECQNADTGPNKEAGSLRAASPSPRTVVDLPRSRSVLHVNKHEFSITTGKNISTKISKSISNVNGFKDYNAAWNQSKLSLTSETDNSQKMTEEISRLITLANAVLSTKIPDLACNCNDSKDTLKNNSDSEKGIIGNVESNTTQNLNADDTANAFIYNTIYDSKDAFDGLTNTCVDDKEVTLSDFIVSSSPLSCGLENDFTDIVKHPKDNNLKTRIEPKRRLHDKRNEYNHNTNFIEDESGFSSMSSFQEIGIPIISIIPPSPCKEVGYIDEFSDILDGAEKWESDTMKLEKPNIKVFWV